MGYHLNEVFLFKQALAPQSLEDTSGSGAAINAAGYSRAHFNINIGALAESGTLDAQVYQSSGSAGTYAAVSSGSIAQVTTTGSKIRTLDIPLVAATPWLKLVATAGSTILVQADVTLYQGTHLNPPSQDLATVEV